MTFNAQPARLVDRDFYHDLVKEA